MELDKLVAGLFLSSSAWIIAQRFSMGLKSGELLGQIPFASTLEYVGKARFASFWRYGQEPYPAQNGLEHQATHFLLCHWTCSLPSLQGRKAGLLQNFVYKVFCIYCLFERNKMEFREPRATRHPPDHDSRREFNCLNKYNVARILTPNPVVLPICWMEKFKRTFITKKNPFLIDKNTGIQIL